MQYTCSYRRKLLVACRCEGPRNVLLTLSSAISKLSWKQRWKYISFSGFFLFFSSMHIINTRHESYHKKPATRQQQMKTVREMKNFRCAFYSFHPRLPNASPCKTVRNSVTYSLIKKLRSRDGVYVITHHPLPTPCTPLFSFSHRSFIFSNSYSSYENPLFPPCYFWRLFSFL